MSDLKSLSKSVYSVQDGATVDNLQTSALMRIADATELMARNYIQLQRDLDYYKNRNNGLSQDKEKLYRQISALKGVITKVKKQKSND